MCRVKLTAACGVWRPRKHKRQVEKDAREQTSAAQGDAEEVQEGEEGEEELDALLTRFRQQRPPPGPASASASTSSPHSRCALRHIA